MEEAPSLRVDEGRGQTGSIRTKMGAVVLERGVVTGLRDRTLAIPEPVRMDMFPAKRQNVEPGARKRRAGAAILRYEHVAAAVVVEDPADVTVEKVLQVEVALVGEAPDPFARVVERAGAALPRAPLRVDVQLLGHRAILDGWGIARPFSGARQRSRQD